MRHTGITRPVDELGRIVIPMSLRRQMNIVHNTPLVVYVENGMICLEVLKEKEKCCVFCGFTNETFFIFDRPVCLSCIDFIATFQKEKTDMLRL